MDFGLILNVVIWVLVVGGVVCLVNLAPIDPTIKKAGSVVILLIALLYAIKLIMRGL